MDDKEFTSNIKIGFLELSNPNDIEFSVIYINAEDTNTCISLTPELRKPWNSHTFATIDMLKLPDEIEEKDRSEKWFQKEEYLNKKIKLKDGSYFNSSIFPIISNPTNWQHESYARNDSDFFHIYKSNDLYLHVRMFSEKPITLDNPFFNYLTKNTILHLNDWHKDKLELALKQKYRCQESKVENEFKILISNSYQEAKSVLKIDNNATSEEIINKIYECINNNISFRWFKRRYKANLANQLGALWGETLIKKLNWEWCNITDYKNNSYYAICNQDRSFATNPISNIYSLLNTNESNNNSALLFNMITDNGLPESIPNSYDLLS